MLTSPPLIEQIRRFIPGPEKRSRGTPNCLTKGLMVRRISGVTPDIRKENAHEWISLAVFLFFIFLPALTFAQRPFLATESAVPVDRGAYRLETGIAANRFSAGSRGMTFNASLRYGLIQNLEIDFELPYLFFEDKGNHVDHFGDVSLKTKVRFLKGRVANPLSLAGMLVIKFPSAGKQGVFRPEATGEADVGLWAIATKEFDLTTAHINFGYILIGNPAFEDREDQVRYSLGLEHGFWDSNSVLFAELSGTSEVDDAAPNDTLVAAGGFSYEADMDLFIDASVGFGLTSDSPDYVISGGLTYYFH